jgi:hypothetical protein
MLRQDAHLRTTFAGARDPSAGSPGSVRQRAASAVKTGLRLIVAPFALAAAAAAGLLFALLLPICGIATISEGIAKASWRFVRAAFAQVPHSPPRRI